MFVLLTGLLIKKEWKRSGYECVKVNVLKSFKELLPTHIYITVPLNIAPMYPYLCDRVRSTYVIHVRM